MRGIIAVVGGSLLVAGMLTCGLLINKLGRKRLLVGGAIPAIIFAVSAYILSIFIPNVWIVLGLRFSSAFIGGFALVAGQNLSLEQVPKFRGTMMALGQALSGIGGATGIFAGGLLLNYIDNAAYGYPAVAILLWSLGILGALNVFFLAKDPVKEQPKENKELNPGK